MELATTGLDNDTRGWIMTIASGLACTLGSAIIFVDVAVRQFPGQENFRIQESNLFLACSLSLSFGIMLFSSLNSMLPESKDYLKKAGWSDHPAGLLMMACFIGGFVGIQAISRLLHQYMPSHVVDCDHSHDENANLDEESSDRTRTNSRASRARRRPSRRRPSQTLQNKPNDLPDGHDHAAESTPLLMGTKPLTRRASAREDEMVQRPTSPLIATRNRATTGGTAIPSRRPSMFRVQRRVMSFVKDTKCNCDESGPCYGFSDPCGQECFKHLSGRSGQSSQGPGMVRTKTAHFDPHSDSVFQDTRHPEADDADPPISPKFRTSRETSRDPWAIAEEDSETDHAHQEACSSHAEEDIEAQHHHHVPTNAFLSIGLQTSIAIALHKFPEGFITYASNHASPSLGFNIFMALFVHNISEGFAMALPLYMALNSRWRALAWSSLLGGLSQPVGALIAVVWFKIANKTHLSPNAEAYACLFAVTAGIMVSVALQLFVEAMSLNHNRNLCIFFGFLGMAILGLSNALFASH